MKVNKNIEIVRTTTGEVISMGENTSNAILVILKKHYKSVIITIIDSREDLDELVKRRPNLVLNGVKNIPSSIGSPARIWVADYLEQNGIAVTGSGTDAHILEADKFLAKQCLLDAGINTSKYRVVRQNETLSSIDIPLTYPVFIKPTSKGGGVGIDNNSVAHTFEQLVKKVENIAQNFGSDSLIEEYLPGREFSVAILKDEATYQYSIMPLELIAPLNSDGYRILSHAVKAADTETFIPVTDQAIKIVVGDLALDAFQAIGARDYGRIDIRMDIYGSPQFLEANLIPSLKENFGNFPKACKLNMNLNFESVILRIVRLGLFREITISENTLQGIIATPILIPQQA